MYNTNKPYKALLISYLELYALRSRGLLDTGPCQTVSVYDKFGRKVYPKPHPPCDVRNPPIKNPFPPEIQVLFFSESLSTPQIFYYLKLLYIKNIDAIIKINFLEVILKINYKFIVQGQYIKLTGEETKFEFSKDTDPSIGLNWELLFNLPNNKIKSDMTDALGIYLRTQYGKVERGELTIEKEGEEEEEEEEETVSASVRTQGQSPWPPYGPQTTTDMCWYTPARGAIGGALHKRAIKTKRTIKRKRSNGTSRRNRQGVRNTLKRKHRA